MIKILSRKNIFTTTVKQSEQFYLKKNQNHIYNTNDREVFKNRKRAPTYFNTFTLRRNNYNYNR